MRVLKFLFVSVFFLSKQCYCLPQVHDYIDNKLRENHIDLNRNANAETNNVKLSSSLKTVHIFEKYYSEGYIIGLFDEIYLTLGPELIRLSNNSRRSVLTARRHITFAKGIEYKKQAFLATCFGNTCDFYMFSDETDVIFIQTIIFQNASKHFQYFIINEQLHFSMDNSIYLWTGTYFDQMYQLPLDCLILCTFPSNMGSQIVIAQVLKEKQTKIYVYELIDEFVMLQTFINMQNVNAAISYVYANVQHVIFMKDHGSPIIYRWIDSELEFLANLEQFSNAKIYYGYVNKTVPIFVLAKMNTISLYQIRKKEPCLSDIALVNVSRILDVSIGNDFKINLLSDSIDGKTIFSTLQFQNNIIQEDTVTSETNELYECINKLEGLVNSLKLEKHDPTLLTKSFQTRSVRDSVGTGENNPNTRVFNGKVIIKNNLHAQHLKINKSLFIKNLNGIEWTPDKWLSKSKDQLIGGPVVATSVNVRTLENKDNPLFTDLLFTSSDKSISSPVLIANDVICNTIEGPRINDINLQDLYLKNSEKLVLGTKQFKNVNTKESSVGRINTLEPSVLLTLFGDHKSVQFNFSKNLQVDSLEVKKINEIDFDHLYSSAFKVGTDFKIEGNVNIQAASISKLVTKRLSGIKSSLILDKVTSQKINSSIEFRNIDAHKITSKSLNGENLANIVHVTNNETVVIQGSVRINDINILGDLHLNDFMSDMAENERILGTNATDLLQIYNRSVRIKGDIIVNNLVLQKGVVPLIDKLPFSYDILENYWMFDKDQTVENHIVFKSGIKVPSLKLNILNDVPFSDYVQNSDEVLSSVNLTLDTLILNGNMFANQPIGCEKLLNESVRITGKYFLTGKKIFAGNVGVNRLKVRQLNGMDLAYLPNQKTSSKSTHTFSTIVFKQPVSAELLTTKFLNNKELALIWNSALRVDMDLKFEQLLFENLTVIKLDVGDVNGVHINEYISSLDQIYQMKSILNVFVSNAIARDFQGVQSINSVPFFEITNHENYGVPLNGDYHFTSNLFIKDLKVAVVNGINFGSLTQELMYRYWSQDITGYHTFNVIRTAHLGAPKINSYNLESLIDSSSEEPQELLAPGGLVLQRGQFAKSLYSAHMKNDINKLTNMLRNEPTRFWSSVTVMGNVELLDEECEVQQLINQAVYQGSNNDTFITGQVTFENIQVKNVLIQSINGIDIGEVFKDAVLKNEADQIITGKKEFIKLSAQAAASLQNVDIPIVNKILLTVVNESIIHKNAINAVVIKGRKTFFEGLQADRVICKNISNAPVEDFVTVEQPLRPIGSIKFDKLQIRGDLQIGKINKIDFSAFLANRLLLDGPRQTVDSVAYFDTLNLIGPAVILPAINKIFMSDVVFDEETLIESTKVFENTIHCSKAFVELANGYDVTKMYESSVFYDDPVINVSKIQFDSNVVVSDGPITTTTLNHVNMDFIRDMVDVSVIMGRSEIIRHNIDNIRESLLNIVPTGTKQQASQFAYLDKATELQINLPNTVDGRVSVSNADLLLHVDAEEVASFCELPSNCTCHNQHTVHISPSYSVGILENKGYQRVFTYFNRNTAVNIVTSTISFSNLCRTENATDEFTAISWTIAKTHENKDQTSFVYPESIPGYLNDVSFFEINDVLYFVLSRFYDVHTDTGEVDAIIMRFSDNRHQARVIQYIPSRKSSAAKVLQTTGGIILVIDSTPKMTVGTDIDGVVNVYRFNEELETFVLLRSIMDGPCSNSQLLQVDSETHFIVLTCRDSVKVLKYYLEFRNYYLFQVISEPHLVSATVIQPDAYLRTSPLLFISRTTSVAVFRFRYLSGFSLFHEKTIQGMKTFVPFTLNTKQFLFCPRLDASLLLKVIING